MRKCSLCQRLNQDEAAVCFKCGKTLSTEDEVVPSVSVSEAAWRSFRRLKWCFWLAAWGCVVLATLLIDPRRLTGVFYFPIGLFVWMPGGSERAIVGFMEGAWIIGWVVYGVLSAVLLGAEKRSVFWMAYGLFIILLVLNVVGCDVVIKTASEIH